jgi:hypothetical protein
VRDFFNYQERTWITTASAQNVTAIGTQEASLTRSARRRGVRIKQMLNYSNMSNSIILRRIGLAES